MLRISISIIRRKPEEASEASLPGLSYGACATDFQMRKPFCVISDRVLAPVIDSLIPMRAETQQNVARITLKTFCEAWLEHIRGRRIKFRYKVA